MDTIATLNAINLHGIRLRVAGGRLLAEPKAAVTDCARTLIREHRDALVELLESDPSADSLQDHAAALHLGRLVLCQRCTRFQHLPHERPDGACELHGPVWARVPFTCPDYKPRTTSHE